MHSRTSRKYYTKHNYYTQGCCALRSTNLIGINMSSSRIPRTNIEVRCQYLVICRITEPTNKIAPRSDKSRKFEGGEIFLVSQAQSVYLTCEVAGYPAPVFR